MKDSPPVAALWFRLKRRIQLEKIPAVGAVALITFLMLGAAGSAWAQGGGDTPRVQVFGGYSYTRFDSPSFGFSNPSGLNGYTFAPAFNLIRGFGVVAELSGQYGTNINFRDITVGPQFLYPKGKAMFFAHVMFGKARSLVQVGAGEEDTERAVAVGGGMDLRPYAPLRHTGSFRWITSTRLCFRRSKTITGFRQVWCIAGARSRRRGTDRP